MGILDIFKSTEHHDEDDIENTGNTLDEDIHNIAKDMLTEVLDLMGFFNVVKVTESDKSFVSLEIKGDDLGRIIGKEGNTLYALQLLLRNMLSKKYKRSINVHLDANNYREKRASTLKSMAIEAAEKALSMNQDVALKPMSPWERRVVHMALQDDERIETKSRGKDQDRQVVISPVK